MEKNNRNSSNNRSSRQVAGNVQDKLLNDILALSPAIINNPSAEKFGFVLSELDSDFLSSELRIAQEIEAEQYSTQALFREHASLQPYKIGLLSTHASNTSGTLSVENLAPFDASHILHSSRAGSSSSKRIRPFASNTHRENYQNYPFLNQPPKAVTSNRLNNHYRSPGIRTHDGPIHTPLKAPVLEVVQHETNINLPTEISASLFLGTNSSDAVHSMSRGLLTQSTSPMTPNANEGNLSFKPKKTASTKRTSTTKAKNLRKKEALEAQLDHILEEKEANSKCPSCSNCSNSCPKSSREPRIE